MLRMLEAQAPAKQRATDTINTLSARLNNATLLEDRRAAILGLRSFAKEYPASVASGALRGLIGSLTKDREDVDTIKSVLETLLMLFNPSDNSPEASDDIALWLADEFSQRQDNIKNLLDLLETHDFYSRLYSLQLISAVLSARPARTQECILSAPLGTTRLVAVLDDPRDAVRNAGLLLLTDLTQSSLELQKLVAFENAFDRVFRLIESEGALDQGGIIVQDCLSLLANLLRYNVSNQSLFRETGYITKLAQLLPSAEPESKSQNDQHEEAENPQKEKNLWGMLAVLRIFLIKGGVGTPPSQVAFQRHGMPQLILALAFNPSAAVPIRAEALYTCADMIRGNPNLQEEFARHRVTSVPTTGPTLNGASHLNGDSQAYVIDGLLHLVLAVSANNLFDVRLAACECIKAYFYQHAEIRLHFIRRAIEGHKSGSDETPNFLSALLLGPQGQQSADPYKIWFAAVLALHLVFDDNDAKSLLMSVAEGNAENGEEEVSCIQIIAGHLVTGLENGEDERISIAYLMLLTAWLFDDPAAVNDFLGEGSIVQSLVQATIKSGNEQPVTRGLCAILLGVLYEFSTKDSPISRRTLQPVLVSRLGRERYLDAVTELRQHPLVRDFEVLPQGSTLTRSTGLPDVFFDKTFVEFLKDSFSRLIRAIDRDPNLEAKQSHGAIDRDLVDSLRAQLEDKTQLLNKAESDLVTIERRLNQEQADHRRDQEMSAAEINRIKKVNEALQRASEMEIKKVEEAARAKMLVAEEQHRQQTERLVIQEQQTRKEAMERESHVRAKHEHEMKAILASSAEFERRWRLADEELSKTKEIVSSIKVQLESTQQELQVAKHRITESQSMIEMQTAQITELKNAAQNNEELIGKMKVEAEQIRIRLQNQEWSVRSAKDRLIKAEEAVKQKEEARVSARAELDDMLMVLADLEEKRAKDKERLKSLGEEVSDADDDAEDNDQISASDEDAEDDEHV